MTEIHAAVPSNLVEHVREAQSRGDVEEVKVEAKAVEAKLNGKGKAKARAKITPVGRKLRTPSAAEDEENLKRRPTNAEDSDPETDWIPGPTTLKTSEIPRTGRSNIFGIHGLADNMRLGSSEPSRVTRSFRQSDPFEEQENDMSDPFITIPAKQKPTVQQSFNLRGPSGSSSTAADAPGILKFADISAIQPNNQRHPLLEEFSWSWTDSQIMHETGSIKNGESKTSVRKRLASEDFEKRRTWELKKFKKAGYDLKRYNRGDFGPRTGLNRL